MANGDWGQPCNNGTCNGGLSCIDGAICCTTVGAIVPLSGGQGCCAADANKSQCAADLCGTTQCETACYNGACCDVYQASCEGAPCPSAPGSFWCNNNCCANGQICTNGQCCSPGSTYVAGQCCLNASVCGSDCGCSSGEACYKGQGCGNVCPDGTHCAPGKSCICNRYCPLRGPCVCDGSYYCY